MRSPKATAQFTTILVALLIAPLAPSAEIYWTDFDFAYDGGISRADLDTFTVETLIPTGLGGPYRIALDPPGGKMYWTSTVDGTVKRANLDGSSIETIYDGGGTTLGIAVDSATQKVYWSRGGNVYRSNLDGSDTQLLFDGGNFIQDLALDPANRKLYLSDWDGSNRPGRLRRADLDGSGLEDVVTGIYDGPLGLGVDAEGGKVYWARFELDDDFGSVQRANLDGSGLVDIVPDVDADSLALDPTAGHVYWTEPDFDTNLGLIRRADFDGSNVETLPLADIFPGGIAIIPEPGAAMLLLAGGVAALRRRS